MLLKATHRSKQIKDDSRSRSSRLIYQPWRGSIRLNFLLIFLLAWVCTSLTVLSSSLDDGKSSLRGGPQLFADAISPLRGKRDGGNTDEKRSLKESVPSLIASIVTKQEHEQATTITEGDEREGAQENPVMASAATDQEQLLSSMNKEIMADNWKEADKITGEDTPKAVHEEDEPKVVQENPVEAVATEQEGVLSKMAKEAMAHWKEADKITGEEEPKVTREEPAKSVATEQEQMRSEAIKEAMAHTWKGYETYAFGRDELKPVSAGYDDNWMGMAATMLDGMDTLWLMDMKDEFKRARDHIVNNLNWNAISSDVSVFETTIRAVGGLLSAAALSNDDMLSSKAEDLMKRMLPAFDQRTGLAYSRVDLKSGNSFNYGWAGGGSGILSEFGSLTLELNELSRTSGDPQFSDIGMKAYRTLENKAKANGLYGVYGDVKTGSLTGQVSFGAYGDSFYEYLLKTWIQTGRKHQWLRDMYDRAIDGLESILKYTPSNLPWLPGIEHGRMEHLTCFVPGMLALGTLGMPKSKRVDRDMRIAKGLMETCWQMNKRTKSGISPDEISFQGDYWDVSDREYKLRPESIESLYVLHKITGDSTYRDKGWEIFQNINKYCRTKYGYGHLPDVNNPGIAPRDKMESFWVGETLKYHYLLQIPVESRPKDDEWVFNTEAHLLPIQHPV